MATTWCAIAARLLPLVLIAALAACGGDDPGDKTVRLQVSGEPEETAVYQALVNAYTKKYPDRKVELVRVASNGDHLARLSSAFAAGNPPDTFLINYREYAQFVARGALQPVGPGLEQRGLKLGDYYQQPVEAFTYRGALQCMPQNVSSLVVYYNPAVFSARGVPAPAAGWTWNDFADTARRLSGGDVHGLGVEPTLVRLAPFVWANGGEIVDDPAKPTRFTLDTPAARGAIEFLAGLIRDPKVVPDLPQQEAQDLETRFAAGKLGMYLGSRRDTPKFREVSGLKFAVAPLPVGKRQATLLHSDAYCVAAEAPNADAALDFIRYAMDEQGQRLAALSGRTVPSLKSVADSPVFLDPARPPAGSQTFLDGIPHMHRTPVMPAWPEIEDIADEELTQLFYARKFDVDAALRELDRRTRPLLSR